MIQRLKAGGKLERTKFSVGRMDWEKPRLETGGKPRKLVLITEVRRAKPQR